MVVSFVGDLDKGQEEEYAACVMHVQEARRWCEECDCWVLGRSLAPEAPYLCTRCGADTVDAPAFEGNRIEAIPAPPPDPNVRLPLQQQAAFLIFMCLLVGGGALVLMFVAALARTL